MTAPRRPPFRTAPDLVEPEAALAGLLAQVRRTTPSMRLQQRCLGAGSGRVPADGYGRPVLAGWWRPLPYAAAALLALGAGVLGGSHRALEAQAHPDELAVAHPTLRVVDDPSVPLFHGVETFQELALWDRSAAEGRGSR